MISALQHYLYCPRQCALIHVEQTYADNLYTARGNRVHERVHQTGDELVAGVRVERALPLRSESLGLTGVADVVEFLEDGTPYPIEYKAGPRKNREADNVQLCAQAMCLEEMLGLPVPEGSVYHAQSRRRRVVQLDEALRATVIQTVEAVRELFTVKRLPEPAADDRCTNCSLIEVCLPFVLHEWNQRSIDPFVVDDPA